MAYTVLARRYRSATFDDLVGQNHIAQTLKKAITSGRIAHAYLFCGTRGVGKTSLARILAKALNCKKSDGPTAEPCLTCASCLAVARGEDMDVIEIDAASNTGVDNVRDIIANSQYRPANARFKVYIIDEVHMLSKAAFNALLKTMEEPPEHVKFILATTEVEKVLPTILSRCQRFDFRNIPTREIAGHLAEICKQEKIHADEDALLLVAKAGAGSMRDALSLLDRLLSIGEKKITAQMIEQLLGLPKAQLMFDLAGAIGAGDVKEVLTQTDRLISEGLSPDTLVVSLVDHLRNLLVLRTCGADSALVDVPNLSIAELARQAALFDPATLTQDIVILEELRRQLRSSTAGRALLDATFVRLAMAEQFASVQDLLSRVDGNAPAAAAQKKKSDVGAALADRPADRAQTPIRSAEAAPTVPPTPVPTEPSVEPLSEHDISRVWPQLLTMMSEKGQFLRAALGMARLAGFVEGQAIIRFPRSQETFAKLLAGNGKKEAIQAALSQLLARPVGVKFEVEDDAPAQPEPASAAAPTEKPEPARPAAAPPPPASTRPTPQQMSTLEQDPLIKLLMEELGASIVKITDEQAE